MNIYTLPNDVEAALASYYNCFDPDTGEQTATDEGVASAEAILNDLMNRADENLQWYVSDIMNHKARIAGIKSELERLSKLAKGEQRKIDAAEALVDRAFGRIYEGKSVAFGNFTLSYRKSEAVVVEDEAKLPSEYLRMPEPPKPEPDKTKIKEAIKAGNEVSGASIEVRQNLSIR